MIDVKVQLVDGGKMPTRATTSSAGMDLYACINSKRSLYYPGLDGNDYDFSLDEDISINNLPGNYTFIEPGETKVISAGFKIEIPDGYEMQIRPRSGVSAKTKLRVANSPGTIDSDYRGVVGVIIENIGEYPVIIFNGDRIAQAVIQAVPMINLIEVSGVSDTERGSGGFGSTGMK